MNLKTKSIITCLLLVILGLTSCEKHDLNDGTIDPVVIESQVKNETPTGVSGSVDLSFTITIKNYNHGMKTYSIHLMDSTEKLLFTPTVENNGTTSTIKQTLSVNPAMPSHYQAVVKVGNDEFKGDIKKLVY